MDHATNINARLAGASARELLTDLLLHLALLAAVCAAMAAGAASLSGF
jgi:hypothetical protein